MILPLLHRCSYGPFRRTPMGGSQRPCFRSWSTAIVLAFVSMAIPRVAVAGTACEPLRPQDQIWLVSTRRMTCLETDTELPFHVQRFDQQEGWQPADSDQLRQDNSTDSILVVYVHGNRMSGCDAIQEGLVTYRMLVSDLETDVPVTYVIWSWSSDRVRGQLRDIRLKAWRTEVEGYYLGRWLLQVSPDQRVSLIGFSFGARIATGALHLLGGGRLSGRVLDHASTQTTLVRTTLTAAAMPDYWLQPGGYHEMAMSRVDRLLNVYNSCDPVLRRYRMLDKCSRPEALGFTGMYSVRLGDVADRYQQFNGAAWVGKVHRSPDYFRPQTLRRRIQSNVLWLPSQADDAPAPQPVSASEPG